MFSDMPSASIEPKIVHLLHDREAFKKGFVAGFEEAAAAGFDAVDKLPVELDDMLIRITLQVLEDKFNRSNDTSERRKIVAEILNLAELAK
ncbi:MULTISPECIES: hypothetical protein [Bradyrhizobium]|uniref:Uncharacterized protein n=1 Tax=Bradyrhizobium elkanii TaxID=29448 RepID=A0A8I1Y999_BRAEL|nr:MULTISPECIES: hypothetical protein [Bradyrhizobium]MBP1295696.1 hypothetical protein [Bradyrhizobium elkanii]MCP1933405.1 hypothetical protein [Bradyrhizobium elkanii]MCP1968167.1 hypothetical protein [Bradyrhizobium elkanii]MCS3478586.1 hypothetical protein [Bradyrhizobium elkanii]MCS3524449.1 hypothetical protein [Bradyrhizobium elkanii]